MTRGRIRRAQLVSPFGAGAMTVLVDGTSVITAGLDHWYESDDPANVQIEEFKVDEWRLARRLKVSHFRLPPDHRTPVRGAGVQPNIRLTVPVLRFPRWGFCPYCKRLQDRPYRSLTSNAARISAIRESPGRARRPSWRRSRSW
jgi:hypothetical protein